MAGIFTKVREMFSSGATKPMSLDITSNLAAGGIGSATTVTSDLGKFLSGMSNFSAMSEHEIYEQFYVWEPEISSTINKTAAMVRSSFKYFTLIDDAEIDNLPPNVDLSTAESITQDYGTLAKPMEDGDNDLDDITANTTGNSSGLREEMRDTANEIARNINVSNIFEVYAAMMYTHGEVFLRRNEDMSLSIIPNDRVTILDDLGRKTGSVSPMILIAQENFLIIDEKLQTEIELKPGEFVHIKLYDVPLNLKDSKGRSTFGIYSISPLQRCIIPIWMKRQIYMIETLWRWANVPREHHTIAAEAYKLNLYPGTPEMKKKAAEKDMSKDISSWSAKLQADAPDQKYVTSSNIQIKPVEHNGSSYMESNGLLTQIEDAIWDGVGMPKSVIKGKSDGSYASELITASGASMFIEQIASKIAAVVLQNMRDRLLIINPQYPVNQLDIKIDFEIAQSRLERMKNMQLMKESGQFTGTEIREEVGKPALTDDQLNNEGVVTSGNVTIIKGRDVYDTQGQMNQSGDTSTDELRVTNGAQGIRGDGTVSHPSTPQSANTQGTDAGDAVTENILYKGQD